VSYSFIDRYCKITAKLPEPGIVVITGWVTEAASSFIFIMDENNNHTLIKREQLVGSIVVLMEQRKKETVGILSENGMCEVGGN
jgi:hypothetical protein